MYLAMPLSSRGPGTFKYLNFLICKIRLMIVAAPASEACRMDSLNRYIKGMFDKNEEDLPQ